MEKKSQLKLFVCESDFRVLKRLESWIYAMGEDVLVSDDGIEALKLFDDERPDILLISQDLKSMGGIELIEKIKEIVPNQAVIMMISDEDLTLFKRAIDLQVDKYLNTPVEATQLFNAVTSLAQEKLWHEEFKMQEKILQDYKDAIDLSFSVTRHDTNGEIFYVNDLFCIETRLRHQDAMKGIINPLNNPNENMEIVWDALKTDLIYRDRQVFKLENKKERIIDITAVGLSDDDEVVYEYLVFSNDVTDIIHSARKIKNQELDSKIDKLNHAKQINEVKDSFLTIFTHELKTPLNSIINFSQYVQKHLAKEDFKKRDSLIASVKEINKSGWFMFDMISNLLEAMKLRDSKIVLDIAELNIVSVVDNLITNSFNELENKKIIKTYDDEFKVFSDEKRLDQIVKNLLSNAVNHADSTIEIILKSTDNDFTLEIIDDGDGFAEKTKVFDLFEQSDDDSMTRESTGTGVGLYIVKQVCDRMSYKIELLDSTKLGGARVVVSGKRDIRE